MLRKARGLEQLGWDVCMKSKCRRGPRGHWVGSTYRPGSTVSTEVILVYSRAWKCSPWASRLGITYELVRKADSWALPLNQNLNFYK